MIDQLITRTLHQVAAFGIATILLGCTAEPVPKVRDMVSVAVSQVGIDLDTEYVSGTGTVRLRQETSLGFTTAGRIARITVNAGDRVRKGQVLALLDLTNVDSRLAAANAELTKAAGALRRSKALYRQGWITKARLEADQASYDAALAETKARRFANSTARIIAPSAGIVLARTAQPTEVVSEGAPVLTLGEESRGYVLKVSLPDRDAARILVGSPTSVRIAALNNDTVSGKVLQIGGRAEEGTGTFEVEIGLPVLQGLRSGQIGTAEIKVSGGLSPPASLLPASALFASRAGEGFVYVVADRGGHVSLRKVSISRVQDNGVLVTSGVSPGEWVVVSGVERVTNGQVVRVERRMP